MNKLFLLMLVVLFSGCTKYVEVTKELAFFPYKKCEKPKRVKVGKNIFIGDDVDFLYTKGMFGDYALTIIPNMDNRLDFNETMYSYPQSQLDKFIACYTKILVGYDKNEAVIRDNNSKVVVK